MDRIREQEVTDRILEILERFVTDRGELDALSRGEPIVQTLTIDSLAVLQMVNELESLFNVRFDYESIETAFQDIHTLAAFLGGESGKVVG